MIRLGCVLEYTTQTLPSAAGEVVFQVWQPSAYNPGRNPV